MSYCKEIPCEEPNGILRLGVIVHEADQGGFWAEVPTLPGVFTQGETREELMANIVESAEGWLLCELDRVRELAAHPEDGGAPGEVCVLDLAAMEPSVAPERRPLERVMNQ